MGGRHIDTAVIYANHAEIGRGIKRSNVPREEIFVTTKIWPDEFGFEKTYDAVIRSLQELQLDYVDLMLLHVAGLGKEPFPACIRHRDGVADWSLCRKGAWAALNNFKRAGQVHAIGVSNFCERHIEELMVDSQYPVQVNQIELHPWNPNLAISNYCQERGIIITAYGSLGSRRMASQLLDDASLKDIGLPVNKTAGQVLLRWAVQNNVIVIPGTSNPAHMRENLDIFDFELEQSAMEWLSGVPSDQQMCIYGHQPETIL